MCERTGLKFIPLFIPLRHSVQSAATGITPVSTPYDNVQSDESMSVESENDYTVLEESLLYHNSSCHQQSSDSLLTLYTNPLLMMR